MMDFLRIRLLRTGLVFFGILLVIYSFSSEKGSSASNDPTSENIHKGPVIVRNKVSLLSKKLLTFLPRKI
jgi:hypothetical protein